jgi:hypothetical protein
MGRFFEAYEADRCCLCGSAKRLTGEHKVKASALAAIFGKDAMFIGTFDGTSAPRLAQGPKSRTFHFSAPLCASCNGARTQGADREFDRFHAHVAALLTQGEDPASVFSMSQYAIGSDSYLNVFRYFAKLLCCQVADSRGPRALAVSEFAIGRANRNPVFLYIDADPTYALQSTVLGTTHFAAHGGLVVPVNRKTRLATSFHSTLSLGAVRYTFWIRYGSMVGIALRLFHRDFWRKCDAAYREALKKPLSHEERQRLGI